MCFLKNNYRYALRKTSFGLLSVAWLSFFLVTNQVSADEISSNVANDTSSQVLANDSTKDLEVALNRSNDVKSLEEKYQAEGFQVSLTEDEISYPGAHAAEKIATEINQTYDQQQKQIEAEVASYKAKVAEEEAKQKQYQEDLALYREQVKEKERIEAANREKKTNYEIAQKKYEEAEKTLGQEYQFTDEDKKTVSNGNSDPLKLYGELDQTKKNSIDYYKGLKVKADLDALDAHSLQESITWNKNTTFEKVSGNFKVSEGMELKDETSRISHTVKLTGYKVNDSFVLKNVGKIETGDSLDLKVTITQLGEGYGQKKADGSYTVEQALYIGKEFEKLSQESGSIEFVYRNHRDMGFKFEFLVNNKPTKILITQVIGDIDLGQKIQFDFGQDGKKLFSVPQGSKITNNNETFTSAADFNVQNFDKTPEGTMLAVGVGTEMNYHHITEDSYYQYTDSNYKVLSQLTEAQFDKEKLALMAGTSTAAPGQKRVGGILFSLFGNSVKLNEVVKPEPPTYEQVLEPQAPTPLEKITIEKPKLSLKSFRLVPMLEAEIAFDIETGEWPKENLSDPSLPEDPIINDSLLPTEGEGQSDTSEIELIFGNSDFIDVFEDTATEVIGGSNSGALSIQENSDPIYEETYDSEPSLELGQSFLIEESEDTQFDMNGFSGDEVIEEDSQIPVYQFGTQTEVIEFVEDSHPILTGFSGNEVIEEDSERPIHQFGMHLESIEFSEDSHPVLTGFSDDEEAIEADSIIQEENLVTKQSQGEDKNHFYKVTNQASQIVKAEKTALPTTGEKAESKLLALLVIVMSLGGLLSQTFKNRQS
ncbi:Gram-positive signal peptide protein, YSIRK family [Streptococcus porcinus]|uniref:fibronectin binding protein n=1 Tax=Streptococcus porcinus TaxID=1340 RepID=UPI0010CABA79|nr:fibronectin binding protein [Streptococcus porcinus]VTS18263.1 Gram-positive signal peptide protein, YSIRK family [Streptococcus porcinus]